MSWSTMTLVTILVRSSSSGHRVVTSDQVIRVLPAASFLATTLLVRTGKSHPHVATHMKMFLSCEVFNGS